MSSTSISRAIEQLYRDDWSRILANLVYHTRDLEAAEDALQDAIARAIASWPETGMPDNPAGWIHTVAKRIAIDNGRRITTLQGKTQQLQIPDADEDGLHAVDFAFGDDRLRLIFTCCHPVLTTEDRIALTLRLICGLSTAETARLFLVQETTMAARITRAKKRLTSSGVPYQVPNPADLEHRLQDVLGVVYLVATAAHMPGSGTGLHNTMHMALALTPTRVLLKLMPDHPDGNALSLQRMDRTLWNTELISTAATHYQRTAELMGNETMAKWFTEQAHAITNRDITDKP